MEFIPTSSEQERIDRVYDISMSEYTLIRLTDTMIEKNNIDANSLFRDLLLKYRIVDYDQLDNGSDNGVTFPAQTFRTRKSYDNQMRFYRVNNTRGDRRFSISQIKRMRDEGLVKTDDLLMINVMDHKIIIINVSHMLPSPSILESIFGRNRTRLVIDDLIEKLKLVAKNNPHPNEKGPGPIADKDAGDTLEYLLGLKTNNRTDADFEGLIELKTKRGRISSTPSTLFTLRPEFDGLLISKIEPTDRSRVSAFTRYYGYKNDIHPDAKSLFISIGPRFNNKNNHDFYLKLNNKKERVELRRMHSNPENDEVTAFWSYINLKHALEEKHPATLWVNVSVSKSPNNPQLAQFSYNHAKLTLAAQFTTFLKLIETGTVFYDWRGYVNPTGKYGGKNHGNAWRIRSQDIDELFSSSEEIDLL